MTEYDALQIAFDEDNRVLPLAQALEDLPSIYAVRWCGGHDLENLERLTPASGTRYEGMTHPPEEPGHFWIEAMCDQTPEALDSIYVITAALEDYDASDTINVSSPWEGITITISGTYAERSPQDLALLLNTTAQESRDPDMPTSQQTTEQVRRRISGFTQRGALTRSVR